MITRMSDAGGIVPGYGRRDILVLSGGYFLIFLADANPLIPAQSWLNPGDTAWQLTAATFVGMQSIPGLAILYAGLVKKKWALNSAVMCFYAFSIVLLCWCLWGYNMGFGNVIPALPAWFQVLGIPGPSIGAATEIGQATIPLAAAGLPPLRFSGSAMIYFQFVFAAITPILIAGSILGRMNFKAWMIFVPVWSTIVYTVGAFMLWGGGMLSQWGAADYSGGYVIHLAAGISGFVAAAMVGPRLLADRKDFEPNNLIVALAGAGLLWLGWNGLNGGDPYTSTPMLPQPSEHQHRNCRCAAVLAGPRYVRAGTLQRIDDQRHDHRARRDHARRRFRRWLGHRDRYPGQRRPGSLQMLGKVGFFAKSTTFSVLHTHGVAGLMGAWVLGCLPTRRWSCTTRPAKDASDVSFTGLFYAIPSCGSSSSPPS